MQVNHRKIQFELAFFYGVGVPEAEVGQQRALAGAVAAGDFAELPDLPALEVREDADFGTFPRYPSHEQQTIP